MIIAIDRRFRLTGGRAFALYAMLYTSGRVWIEALRIDTANHIGPFRLNIWTSIIVFAVAAAFFVATRKRGQTMSESGSQDEPEPSSSVATPDDDEGNR